MTIKTGLKVPTVEFILLQPGDTFLAGTGQPCDYWLKMRTAGGYNAVRLLTGTVAFFPDMEQVKHIAAELHVS